MKYLKKFENEISEKKYKIGDFVVLALDVIKYNNGRHGYNDPIPESKFGEIIELLDIDDSFLTPYIILSLDNIETYTTQDEIERFMTTDEINEYKIKKDTNKFNI